MGQAALRSAMELFAAVSGTTASVPIRGQVELLSGPPDVDQFVEDERGECPACGEKKLKPLPARENPELVAVCLSCGLLVLPSSE
jgi:hypothetical protein